MKIPRKVFLRQDLRKATLIDGTFKSGGTHGRLVLVDINHNGCRVSLNQEVSAGDLIDLELKLPGVSIILSGEVIWTKTKPENSAYNVEAGIRLSDMNDLDRSRIMGATMYNSNKPKKPE